MRSSFDHAIKLTAVAAVVAVSSMSALGKEPAAAPVVSQATPSASVVAAPPAPAPNPADLAPPPEPPASKRLAAPRNGASAPIRRPSDRMPNIPVT